MSLKERLMLDLKESMKSKDKIRKNVVTMIRASIKQVEVDDRIELGDEDIINVISKQLKQSKDAMIEFEKGNRQDLVDLTKLEINILMEYLPEQLTEDELKVMVQEAIENVDAKSMKDMGKIMGYLMPKIKGKADGSMVNAIVKNCFNE